jgi:hypothetical protein
MKSQQNAIVKSFRHSAGFGKQIEYWIIGRMLKEGLDVYVPLVDDHAVDAIVKRRDWTIAQIQIKARSSACAETDAGLFAAIPHSEERSDYWFVFYSERMDKIWILTSAEFLSESIVNKTGKNVGLALHTRNELGLPSSLVFLFTHATLLSDPGRPSATSPFTVALYWLLHLRLHRRLLCWT